MTTKRSQLSLFALCLLIGLTACEKPEEALTPPAVLEKPAPKAAAPHQAGATEIAAQGDNTIADPDANAIAEGDGADPVTGEMTVASDTDELATDTSEAAMQAAIFPPELLQRASAHICFFSFNTSTEYVQLKRMVKQLNAASDLNITITEYQVLDSDPYDNVVALIDSGKQCDGIVLSGHHTDEFYGERSDGDLEVSDLEELACEPRFAPWFGNIKALWLQGCNTVKTAVNNTDLDEDEIIRGSPINHMQSLLDPDDMEDSMEDMRDLLHENTNEENLVNDYMRVFSGATVYGWSFVAPGEQAGAEKSIPYHLAQVTRLVENDPRYVVNPLQTQIPPIAAKRYSEVLYGLLKRPNRPGTAFPPKLTEKTFIQAWRDHGNYRYSYAFDNHDIEAFPALGNGNNAILKQLKGLNCLIHQLDDRLDDMSMVEVADYILRDRSLTTYNVYLLWAMLRSLPVGSDEYVQLHNSLKTSNHLVAELRFNTGNGGYIQKDAEDFLATLGPVATFAKSMPGTGETESATQVPAVEAPVAEKAQPSSPAEADTPPSTTTAVKTGPASTPDTVSPEPWYMNESQDGISPSEEPVFEFKDDSRS